MSLAQRLKSLRKNNDWTKANVARKIGISPSTYHGYEAGTSSPADLYVLKKIASIYHVTVDYLVGYDSKNEYTIPKEINNHFEAILFLKNIIVATRILDEDEVLVLSKMLHFFLEKMNQRQPTATF